MNDYHVYQWLCTCSTDLVNDHDDPVVKSTSDYIS